MSKLIVTLKFSQKYSPFSYESYDKLVAQTTIIIKSNGYCIIKHREAQVFHFSGRRTLDK